MGGLNSILSKANRAEMGQNYLVSKIPLCLGWKKSKSPTGLRTVQAIEDWRKSCWKGHLDELNQVGDGTRLKFIGTDSKLIKAYFEPIQSQTIYLGGASSSRGKDLAMKSNLPQWIYGLLLLRLWVKKSGEQQLKSAEAFGDVLSLLSLSYKRRLTIFLWFPKTPKHFDKPPCSSTYPSRESKEWMNSRLLLSPIKTRFSFARGVPHSFYVHQTEKAHFSTVVGVRVRRDQHRSRSCPWKRLRYRWSSNLNWLQIWEVIRIEDYAPYQSNLSPISAIRPIVQLFFRKFETPSIDQINFRLLAGESSFLMD